MESRWQLIEMDGMGESFDDDDEDEEEMNGGEMVDDVGAVEAGPVVGGGPYSPHCEGPPRSRLDCRDAFVRCLQV